ncbi:MAG: glycosyltransferase [Planctomycetota bacterium]
MIVPTFDRRELLLRTMDSVLAQTHRSIEMIVVDDGSADATAAACRAWAAANAAEPAFELVVHEQPNRGPAAARNAGLERCRGEFVQFLDSDCLLDADKLQRHATMLQAEPRLGLVYCVTDFPTAAGVSQFQIGAPLPDDPCLAAVSTSFSCIAPLWRRSAIGAVRWDEDLCGVEDWVFAARILLAGAAGRFDPSPGAYAVLHDGPRISDHRSLRFLQDKERAMRRVATLVAGRASAAAAEERLSRRALGVAKSYLRLGATPDARRVLRWAARELGHPCRQARLAWAACTAVGPRGLAVLLRLPRPHRRAGRQT